MVNAVPWLTDCTVSPDLISAHGFPLLDWIGIEIRISRPLQIALAGQHAR
jgi:hypothetical protein